MTRILYIAEGEIEERFFDFLKVSDFICSGRFKKFNLMQEKLSGASDIWKKIMDKVYCVLDTDCIEKVNFETLVYNIGLLKRICPRNIFLLIQNKNFENELSYVLECKNLCERFKLKHSTQSDLKRHLAQSVSYSRIVSKENLVRYCRRPEEFKAELKNRHHKSLERKIVLFESSCMKR